MVVTPRPAASLVVVRPGSPGPEVLMLERPTRGYFGGLWVFPGGGVETVDRSELAQQGVAAPEGCDDLEWRAAALRETFEEVGLALTDPPLDGPLVADDGADVYRQIVGRGSRLDATRLRFVSQWVTPVGAPTRFDARFYLTVLDGDPVLAAHDHEVVSMAWVTPSEALARMDRNEWALVLPTIHHLRWLARYPDVDGIWRAAIEATGQRVEPMVEFDGSEVRVRLPDWAELP